MKVLCPISVFPTWGIQQKDWESLGNPTWRPVGFDYRTSTGLEETETLGVHKQYPVHINVQSNEESSDPTRDWDRLDCECLRVLCGSVGQKRPAAGAGALAAAVLGGTNWHKSFLEVTNSPAIEPVDSRTEFKNSKQQTGWEHSPTHQEIIKLKIYWAWPCPPKQDSVLPTASPSSEILPKPLILIQQSIDRSKNSNPTAYRTKNLRYRDITKMTTWITALCNSVKLWAMPSRATQATWVIMESYEKLWSIRKGNDKPLQYSCLKNPMNIMKNKKIWYWNMSPPGW